MTSPIPADHEPWRRPSGDDGPAPGPGSSADPTGVGSSAGTARPPRYPGPPRAEPPPPGWRTPVVMQPSAPRALPPQDHARLDAEEQTARTLSQGVGMVALAVMVLLLLVLCGRAVF